MKMSYVDSVTLWVNIYALVISVIGVAMSTAKMRHLWKTRHLRKVWGFKNGDSVVVVCSELEDPLRRQMVEPREFIYSLKYGDVDAFVEVLVTLLRLYPQIKMRVMSAGEAAGARVDLAKHLVIIGGPDYNMMAERILSRGITQFQYRSPETTPSMRYPKEIVLFDRLNDEELCSDNDSRDFGYFESISNPHNPDSRVILIGGCHTIGVTAAVKAFSMAESEDGDIPHTVLRNAIVVAGRLKRGNSFSVRFEAERLGQTIAVPIVREKDVTLIADGRRYEWVRVSPPEKAIGEANPGHSDDQ